MIAVLDQAWKFIATFVPLLSAGDTQVYKA